MYIIIFILCYLIGNFNAAYIYGKITKKTDIRQHGSGNAGTTNAIRVMGMKAGLIVFISDFLKGLAAVLLAGVLSDGKYAYAIAALAVIIGHNWPMFLKFKGGKGIATLIGTYTIIAPVPLLIALALAFIIIYFTKWVSLASLCGIYSIVIMLLITQGLSISTVLTLVIAVMSTFQHRQNIKRIIKGQENKIELY
jgi:glycerol-3-phosphate acyltransferase PlsY